MVRFVMTMWVLMVMMAGSTMAAPKVTLSWIASTTYEDGVPIEAGKIVMYDIWRSTSAAMDGAVRVGFDITGTTYEDTSVQPRNTYYYTARAYIVESLPSGHSAVASIRFWPPFKPEIVSVIVVK